MQNVSQTQLANYGVIAGVLVILLSKAGIETDTATVVFFIGALVSIGSTIYSWYNRYKKGDISLGGKRR